MKNFLILISIVMFSGARVPAQNLIQNPSFEQGEGNNALNWIGASQNQSIIFKRENGVARTGDYSVSIQKTNESDNAGWIQSLVLPQNKTYDFSAFGKTESQDANFVILIRFWKNGMPVTEQPAMNITQANNTDWKKSALQFFLPGDIDSLEVILGLAEETGKIYFDDIELTEFTMQDFVSSFNCCGTKESFTNSTEEIVYWPDRQYTTENGSGYINTSKPPNTGIGWDIIGGSEGRESLYSDARYGFSEYKFDVENGTYAVKLHFSENEFHWKNKRIQNYQIENIPVLEKFDVFKQGGRSYAVAHKFLTTVTDGQLNITAQASVGKTMISAISVQKIVQDEIPPEIPQTSTITNGFSQNILDWEPIFETDFKGFNIYRQIGGANFELVNSSPHPLSRYIDDNVTIGETYNYKITAIDLWGNESSPTQILSASPIGDEASRLPIYELTISEENLAKLNEDIYSDEYIEANFTYNGKEWQNVGVRYRGNVTQKLSKKNFKINFDNGELFNGMKKLNLNATMNDPSMMIDEITYSLRRDIGILAQNTYPLHLKLNGKFIGVYLQREQEDNYFLENHNLPDANIYRSQNGNFKKPPDRETYEKWYEKENNKSTGYDDLIEFIEFINDAPDEQFKNELPRKFDVGEFLTAYAILNCVADIDQHFHNFLLFHSFKDGRWRICNWDHNTTFMDPRTPIDLYAEESPSLIGQQYNFLFNRLFHIDEFRYFYIQKMLEFANGIFSKSEMQQRLQNYHNTIKFDAERDIYKYGWEDNKIFIDSLQTRINFVNQRVDFIKMEAPKFLPSNFNPLEGIVINEILADNINTISDEKGDFDPWIELYNDGVIPVDLSGCYLTNDFANPTLWQFPGKTMIGPKSYLILWADNDPSAGKLHLSFRLQKTGGEIAVFSPNSTLLDSITYGTQSADVSFGRNEDGNAGWKFFDEPTPNAPNAKKMDSAPVVINEFMASNDSTIADETGSYADWVELYNNSAEIADISGYYLTDDLENPMKWQIPENTKIQAEGFLLIWTDKDPEDGKYHATFKLAKAGEAIGLFMPNGITVVDTITYGEQQTDVSMGRNGDANPEWVFFSTPTPNASNTSTGVSESAAQPIQFNLLQNYPNPFNPKTVISFQLPVCSKVSLKVYDVLGQEVRTLVDENKAAGKYSVVWDGRNEFGERVGSGVYFYSLKLDNNISFTKKLLLLK